MRTIEADVAIVGGGIMGSSTAFFLQKKGKRAVVLERSMISFEASGRNGGGVRQQGRALPEIPLARGAVELWARLDALLGRPTGYRRVGNMFVARTEAEMERLAEQQKQEQALGVETELLGAEHVRELSPGLKPDTFIGGKLCPADGHAIPAQTTVAIAETARDAGAQFFCHSRVHNVGVSRGRVAYVESADLRVEAPVVLDAAGPWAPYISQMVDVYLPIFPSRTHRLETAPMEYVAGPFTITAAWDFGAIQGADGRVAFGGGEGVDDRNRITFNKRLVPGRVEELRRRASEVMPAVASAPLENTWVGLYECTPDLMPIIGPVEAPEGFFICAGFSGHGFALGAYSGQLMAEWIVDGRPSLDLSAFSHRRFQRPEGPLVAPAQGPQGTG